MSDLLPVSKFHAKLFSLCVLFGNLIICLFSLGFHGFKVEA